MSDRTLNVGGRQGRGDPLVRQAHDDGPRMLVTPFFWMALAVCLALWAAFLWVVFA